MDSEPDAATLNRRGSARSGAQNNDRSSNRDRDRDSARDNDQANGDGDGDDYDDTVSLSSSHDDVQTSVDEQPQPYTTERALERDRLKRQRTKEEEIESDEEYLEPSFNMDDIHDDLPMDQNIDLYLVQNPTDIVGERHLSVGMESASQAPSDDGGSVTRRRSRARSRRRSSLSSIRKFHLWEPEFRNDRVKIYSGFALNYVILGLGFMVVLAIYWGSFYNRNLRYGKVNMLVVVDDQAVGSLPPIVGEAVEYTAQLDTVRAYGGWHVYNHSQFSVEAAQQGNSVRDEVIRRVHHRLYWAGIYVRENATYDLYQKLTGADTGVNTGELITAYYESGRDPTTVRSYISSFVGVFEQAFMQVATSAVYPNLLAQLSDSELASVSIAALTDSMSFTVDDRLPLMNAVIFAPLQLGLVYLVIFAFFQFLLSIKVQMYVSARVKGAQYILFRMLTSHLAYLVLGLSYTVLNAAFQLDYKATFGNSGFLVMWAVAYLAIASLGCLNENVALLCFTYFPPLIGIWLVLLMVLNVAPTFNALALCPDFYRYGYAMPIHNSYELFKVIFFDNYKGDMGRNIGILIVWMVLTNALLPFTLKHVAKVNKRRAEAAENSPDKDLEREKK